MVKPIRKTCADTTTTVVVVQYSSSATTEVDLWSTIKNHLFLEMGAMDHRSIYIVQVWSGVVAAKSARY